MDINIEGIIDRYYADNLQLKELLVLHSTCVAQKAMEVLDRHPELDADRLLVWQGAMLHDIGIVRCDAAGIFCYGTEPYIRHGMLGAEMLRNEKLEIRNEGLGDWLEQVARIAERHTGTGLTPETIRKQGLPLPLDHQLCPVSIEEQIVCYADKFYSKSHPERVKTVDQVRQMLLRFPDADLGIWDKWVQMFG